VIYIATYIDIQPSSMTDGAALTKLYAAQTRAENGCLSVDAMQEIGRKNRFVAIEYWKDEASLDAHELAANTVDFRSKLKAIHNSPYDRRVHLGFAVPETRGAAKPGALYVVTHVDVPPPRREETEALLRALVEPSRNEEENVRYHVFQQFAPRTNHFTVFAVWKEFAAFDLHESKPHTRAFREAIGSMLGAPYDERWYLAL
jgi:quinol monooxygenase YgiN